MQIMVADENVNEGNKKEITRSVTSSNWAFLLRGWEVELIDASTRKVRTT